VLALQFAAQTAKVQNKPVKNTDESLCLLHSYKMEIYKLKSQIHKDFAASADKMKQKVEDEQISRRSALAERLKQRKMLKEKTIAETVEEEARAKQRRVKIVEKVVEKEVIKEIVVKKEVVKEVVSKKHVEQQKALEDLHGAVLEQRDKLKSRLEDKQRQQEEEEKQRAEAERKLKELQTKVFGLSGGEKAEDPAVIVARQQKEYRDAQYKLKQQKKKEAKLKSLKKKMAQEQALVKSELRSAKQQVQQNQASVDALKAEYEAKIEKIQSELKSATRKFSSERKSLVKQFENHNRDISFANQLAELFLNPSEISKVWERSERDPKTGLWKLPRINPKKEWEYVRLPEKPGMPAKMGIQIGMDEDLDEDAAPIPRIRKQQVASPQFGGSGGKGGGSGHSEADDKERAKRLKKLSKNMTQAYRDMLRMLTDADEAVGAKNTRKAMNMFQECTKMCARLTQAFEAEQKSMGKSRKM